MRILKFFLSIYLLSSAAFGQGNALHFDGSNDHVVIPYSASHQMTNTLTIETWINPEQGGNIVTKQNYGYGLGLESDGRLFFWDQGSQAATIKTPVNAVKMNRWQHVAVTVQDVGSTLSINFYVDGVLFGPYTSNQTQINNGGSNTTLDLGIQARGLCTCNYIKGRMDEFRLWNIVRTASEIQSNRFNTINASTTGLVAYYGFNHGSAGGSNSGLTALTDQTSNANHGTLTNFALSGTSSNWLESYAMVVPTATTASSLNSTGFTANWTAPAVGTVTNYLLDVSTSSTFSSFVSGYNGLVVNGTSQAVTGLSTGVNYYYRVRADKTSVTGQGAYSNTISALTTMTPPGNALHFDGSNDYVNVPHHSSLNLSASSFSVEFWAKPDTFSSDFRWVVSKDNGNGELDYLMGLNQDNKWRFIARNLSIDISSTTVITTGKWYHIACVFNGTVATLYINGIQEGTDSTVGSAITSTANLLIGARQSSLPQQFFVGSIDEVRIWNVARTQSQIQEDLYNEIASNASGLVAYFNFNHGTASGSNASVTTLTNLTAITNHGTLTNFALSGTSSNWLESYAMVVPTATAASNVTASGFTANWTAPSIGTVTNYLLDVSTSSTFSSFVSGYSGLVVNGTSQAVTGLSASTTYYYRVRADKTSVTGQGAYSSAITATTLSNYLDVLGIDTKVAATAYSLRKLNSNYVGDAIQVRRSSDNTTLNIGFTPAGDLDTTALLAFVGSGSGFVTIWYDQSGNGRNLTQSTASKQPNIVNAGSIRMRNLKPTVYFDATDDGMTFTGSSYMNSNPITVNIVTGSNSSSTAARRALTGSTPNNWLIGPYQNKHAWFANNWNHFLDAPWTTTRLEFITVIQPLSNNCSSFRNGVAQASSNNKGLPGKLNLGAEGGLTNEIFDGYISEVVGYNHELSTAERQSMEASQIAYYPEPSTNADLASLTLSSGTLTPVFASATTSYAASVTEMTSSITVTPTLTDANATIEVRVNSGSYVSLASGAASSALNLNIGGNLIEIKVTAQDGTTIKTYTVAVTRAGDVIASGGNITYSGAYTIHTFTEIGSAFFNPPITSNIEVLVVAGGGSGGGTSGPTSGGHYNGGGGGAGGLLSSTSYAVTAGMTVPVTVGNGGASVTTGDGNNGGNSVFGSMTSIGGGGGGRYGSGGKNGGSGGGSGRDNGTVGVGTVGQGKNGGTGDSGGGGGAGAAGSSSAGGIGISSSITGTATYYAGGGGPSTASTQGGAGGLGGGGNGVNSFNYPTLVAGAGVANTGGGGGAAGVGKPTGAGGSGVVIVKYLTGSTTTTVDASSITISSGSISPSFNANILSYAASSVPNATSSVTVTPTAVNGTNTIQVRVNGGTYATVSSGSPSGSLSLNVGSNTIEIKLSATDGTTKIYAITVTRSAESTDANLSALTMSTGTLSPVFASLTTAYTASVNNATSSITVTPTKSDANATIQVRVNSGSYATVVSGNASSALSLNVGSNTIDVKVTAQDGTTVKTYTITVERSSGIYYVKPIASGSGSGFSWANASSDLQSIINNAVAGEQIWVAAGTYYPSRDYSGNASPSDNRTKTFTLKSGVLLYGGFSGTETLLSQRNYASNISILSGDLGTISTTTDNAYHVVLANNLTNTTVFDGFTIQNGNANVNGAITYGGNNFYRQHGGGLYNANSTYTISNLIFTNNLANENGGAMINSQVNGGVTVTINDCKFLQNSIAGGSGSGAIYTENSVCNINRCIFDGNTGGAISAFPFGNYVVNASVFVNNTGSTHGGAARMRKGNLTVRNSIFANNTSNYGGAIFIVNENNESSSNLYNCTFYNNSAAIEGKAFWGPGSDIVNCIFNGNSGAATYVVHAPNTSTGVGYSMISASQIFNAGSSNLISGSPQFLDTSNLDGADNIWRTSDDGLMITEGSGAFNTGANNTTYSQSIDIVGTTRPQFTTVDLGAYESTVSLFSTNADLSALTMSTGTLSPVFASSTTAYTASVNNATSSITVTPTKSDANATIQVRVNSGSYATVASGNASSALSLNVGSNTIDVKVTAQDGTTVKTYTVVVTRLQVPPTVTSFTPTSGCQNLSTVVITGTGFGTPEPFSASDPNLKLWIDATKFSTTNGGSLSGIISDSSASNRALTSTATYETGAMNGLPVVRYNNNASTRLNTAFMSTSNTYLFMSVELVAFGTTWGSIFSHAPHDNGLQLEQNGVKANNVYHWQTGNDNANVEHTIDYGTQYVMAVKLVNSNQRSFTLYKNNGGVLQNLGTVTNNSFTAQFSSNYISIGNNGNNSEWVNMRMGEFIYFQNALPTSESNIVNYLSDKWLGTNSSAAPVTSVTIGGTDVASFVVNSSTQITAQVGAGTTGTIAVTTMNGTGTSAATFTVNECTNANLSALAISSGSLSPTFDTNTTAYTNVVNNLASSINITPTLSDANATMQVRINGGSYMPLTNNSASNDLTLNEGSNIIDVLVTAENGVTTKTYTISVTRQTAPPGNAIKFDGSNDRVEVANHASLNFGTSSDFTIETWVRYTGNMPDYTGLVVKGTSGSSWTGYQLVLVNQKIAAEIRSGSQLGVAEGLIGTTSLNDGRWHHVAMVVTRSANNVKLYVDGAVEANITNAIVSNNLTNIAPLYLGVERSPALYLNGSMDETRIWNTSRTQVQLQDNRSNLIDGNTVGLVAYYTYDHGIASGVNTGVNRLSDVSSHANHGTLVNFALSGTSSNWMESYAMVVPTAVTASAESASGFTANWNAPAIGTVTNYLLDVSTSSTFSSFVSGYNGLVVNGTSHAVTGLLSETTYYYRVRADKTSVSGQGGNSNTMAATTQSLLPPGNALHFDGSNDYVTIPYAASHQMTNTLTIETWINPSAGGNIVTKQNYGYGLGLESDGRLFFWDQGSQAATIKTPVNAVKMNRWQHVAVTVQDMGSNLSIKFYIDGVLYGPYTSNQTQINNGGSNTTLDLGIQARGLCTCNYFQGRIDEFRLWNIVRTQEEIQANRLQVLNTPATGLVAYFKFDKGIAGTSNSGITTLTDVSTNANNGTLTNFALSGATSNWVESYAMVVPTIQAASSVSSSQFTAHWSAPTVGTVTNYLLDVSSNANFTTFLSGYNALIVNGTSQIVSGLVAGTTYYYRVRADKTSVTGQGGYSSAKEVFAGMITWNGTSWNNITGPTATDDALIDGNYVSSTPLSAKNLTVAASTGFTLMSGDVLHLTGALINEGNENNVIIESGAYLHQTNSDANVGAITIKRAANIKRLDISLWSSPVAAQNLLALSPQTLTNRFFSYSELANNWAVVPDVANHSMDVATGYGVRAPNNWPTTITEFMGTFKGVPNNGAYTQAFTSDHATANYNLIGNPYPSVLDLRDFYNANSSKIRNTIYFFEHTITPGTSGQTNYGTLTLAEDPANNVYVPATSSPNLPNIAAVQSAEAVEVGQGFFVRALTGQSGVLNFDNSMRKTTTSGVFFRNNVAQSNETSKFRLEMTHPDGYINQTVIGYYPESTDGLDNMDAVGLGSPLYTILENQRLASQGFGLPFNQGQVIPLGGNFETTGQYEIKLHSAQGIFENEQYILLHDNELNVYHNLSIAPYQFEASGGWNDTRFEIVFTSILSNENPTLHDNSVILYKINDVLHAQVKGNNLLTSIEIVDLSGRKLYRQSGLNTSVHTMEKFEKTETILLINTTTADGKTQTHKVFY